MEWREPFLSALRGSGNVRNACDVAGVARQVVYRWRDQEEEFSSEWSDAIAEAVELLEHEAHRRAMESSDTLLIFLLKAHKPEVYRESRAPVGSSAIEVKDGERSVTFTLDISRPEGDEL
jgi:transposase-like protein